MAERRNLFSRLTSLFRSGPIVKRKVRGFDSASVRSSAVEIFRKSSSSVYGNALNAYGQYDRLCISLDTQIAVPGAEGFVSLGDLIKKYPNGEKFIVYSYDHEKKCIVPAFAQYPRSSGVKPVVRVTFDDGSSLVCTKDHPCMMRDGSYRDAGDLESNDSMMPFYRKQFEGKSNKDGKKFVGYRNILTFNKEGWNGWQSEHKLIAEWHYKRKALQDEHVHHVDFCSTNNLPHNLVIMDATEHLRLHGQKTTEQWKDPVIRQRMIDGLKGAWENNQSRRDALIFFNQRIDIRNKRREHAISNNPTLDPLVRKKIAESKRLYFSDENNRKAQSERMIELHQNGKFNTSEQFVHYWDGKHRSKNCENLSLERIHTEVKKDANPKAKVVAERLGVSWDSLTRFLKKSGFSGWKEFKSEALINNHKVVSVEECGEIEVGDLTVSGYENFATNTVLVHNSRYADFSEMEYTPEIASALDIYADETVAKDDKGNSLHIYSENPKIQGHLEELFIDTLNIEFTMRPWVRNLVKYGDFFLLNDVSEKYGIINAIPIPVNELTREEGYDPNNPFAVRYRWETEGNQVLENWQVTHFRLLGNDAFLPYGQSVIEPARRIWRQLILAEDAMLVYRVIRSPERRVFYIDVANAPPNDIPNIIEQARTSLKSQEVVDKNTGRVDLRYNPWSVDIDYFLPVRGSEGGTKVDSLPGGQNTTAIDDVEYIQRKLFAALKVPKAYLGFDEAVSSKANLAQVDVRFARTIEVIQQVFVSELNKMAAIHLAAHGYEGEDLIDFTLQLSNPSSMAVQQKLELWRTRFEIAGTRPEGMFSKRFIYKHILSLTDEQIDEIEDDEVKELLRAAKLEQLGAGGGDEGGDFGGGGGGGLGGDFGDDFGGEDEDFGDEGGDLGGDLGGEEDLGDDDEGGGEDEDLFASDKEDAGKLLLDTEEDEINLELDENEDTPVKQRSQISRSKHNRQRRRHSSGASKNAMPDLNAMLKHDNESFTDIYDKRFQRHPTEGGYPDKNPFKLEGETLDMGNAFLKQVSRLENMEVQRRRMDRDLRNRIDSLKNSIVNNGVLSEGFTIEEDENEDEDE